MIQDICAMYFRNAFLETNIDETRADGNGVIKQISNEIKMFTLLMVRRLANTLLCFKMGLKK